MDSSLLLASTLLLKRRRDRKKNEKQIKITDIHTLQEKAIAKPTPCLNFNVMAHRLMLLKAMKPNNTETTKVTRSRRDESHSEIIDYIYTDTTFYDYENEKLFKYLTSRNVFNTIMKGIESKITRKIHAPDLALSSSTRLAVTLRYLSTGESNVSLAQRFKLGKSTICGVLSETCDAIWDHYSEVLLPNLTVTQWLEISNSFLKKFQFPHCLGPMNGLKILNQSSSGVNLLASCDTYHKFTYIALAVVEHHWVKLDFNEKMMLSMLNNKNSNIPKPCPINYQPSLLPYVFTAVEPFFLRENVMIPYRPMENSTQNLPPKQIIFNDKVNEINGALAKTFEIFQKKWSFMVKTQLKTDNLLRCIKAAICLHNFLIDFETKQDVENKKENIHIADIIEILDDEKIERKTPEMIRNEFADYFQNLSDSGKCLI